MLALTPADGRARVQHTYGDVVTAFIAMATHKWVESVAISARFLKVRQTSLANLPPAHQLPMFT